MIYSKIDRLRKDKKITQKELSESIGKTREWYGHILRARKMMVGDLEKIAETLGVSPSFFFQSDYATNNQTSTVKEPNPNKIENMTNLIESQKKNIASLEKNVALLEEKVMKLEHRLADYEDAAKSKQAI
jgi:transcriptional regulator with XRE-family HTH domain